MASTPDIDPYAVLGVQKDATLPDIKSAHRKRVLKCHPDKIQDESQRSKAQDEFQQVQQAYELLSDPARRIKYDQKARLAELRREKMERSGDCSPYSSSPRASTTNTSWECRDGRIYEERTPAETTSFFEEEVRFTQEPRPMSRKHDDFTRRRSKGADDRRRSRGVPLDRFQAEREMARDNAKAYSTRAKHRTRERKREAYAKYEHAAPYDLSDDGSDSSAAPVYERSKRSSEPRRSEPLSRRTRTKDSTRRRDFRDYGDDDYSDEWESKHDYLHTSARDYILRSRGSAPIEIDSRHRGSQSPMRRGYESAGPDSTSPRHSGRATRSSRESARRSNSRSGSYDHLESSRHEPKTPSMPTAATSTGLKGPPPTSRPSLQSTRSATASVFSRVKRENSGRSDSVLYNMVYNDSAPPRSKRRDKYDSGYSSPTTPEVAPGAGSPKVTSTRYKIVTEPETILVEPDKPSRRQRASSPPRQERPSLARTGSKPARSSTYAYPPDSSSRYESKRPTPSRTTSSRPLFGEVEYGPRLRGKDVKYAREIRADDIIYSQPRHHYDDYRPPPVGRRQTTYA